MHAAAHARKGSALHSPASCWHPAVGAHHPAHSQMLPPPTLFTALQLASVRHAQVAAGAAAAAAVQTVGSHRRHPPAEGVSA